MMRSRRRRWPLLVWRSVGGRCSVELSRGDSRSSSRSESRSGWEAAGGSRSEWVSRAGCVTVQVGS